MSNSIENDNHKKNMEVKIIKDHFFIKKSSIEQEK